MKPSKPGAQPPAQPPESGKQILGVAEAAELLGISPAELQRLAQRGILPGTRAMGDWMFPRPMLERWKQDQSRREQQNAAARSAAQKLGGFQKARPLATSTESYDLSIIDELDLPDL
jgi:hypothetical protein